VVITSASESDRQHLRELRLSPDRGDPLRQRRELCEAGRDPDAADVRRPEVVDGYEH
jgi:hypothetical protein